VSLTRFHAGFKHIARMCWYFYSLSDFLIFRIFRYHWYQSKGKKKVPTTVGAV
jgi:hypothetical protein